jgi:hypothetical protein
VTVPDARNRVLRPRPFASPGAKNTYPCPGLVLKHDTTKVIPKICARHKFLTGAWTFFTLFFLCTAVMVEAIKDTISAARNIEPPSHPFYPLGVDIVGYLANKWSVPTLLGIFLGGWLVILGLTWASVSRYSPRLHRNDKLVILWFVLSKPFAEHHFYWPADILLQAEQYTSSSRAILP